MDITIDPRQLRGNVTVIPSKSQAHRYLICAALADRPTDIICPQTSRDIDATVNCLNAIGANICRTDSGFSVEPIRCAAKTAVLHCEESGSTLRFLLPVVGALGIDALFCMEGRLPQRPLSPLWELMQQMGCSLSRPDSNTIRCQGKLRQGEYSIDGGVSSQYISGLMLALPLIGQSRLTVTGKIESRPYIELTKQALCLFSERHSPGRVCVEGDWSNGAFWVTAQFLGNNLTIHGLDPDSVQGDRAVLSILQQMKVGTPTVSAADIPDLIPILSVAAAAQNGAVFTDIHRLRLKESDRVSSTLAMLHALGIRASATEDTLHVAPGRFVGGALDACNDHRIAMSAAIAATLCREPVTIQGAQCTNKSYPTFWEEYKLLGGKYELNLR